MSKFDTCMYAEYFGDYGMRLCNHPSRGKDKTIYSDSCRKCKLHMTEKDGLKKCPFCGNDVSMRNYLGNLHICCNRCNIEMVGRSIDELKEKWNNRT